MSKKTILYDIQLVKSLYKSNNDALIRVAEEALNNKKNELETYITVLINSKDTKLDKDLFSELCNIDWILLNSIFLALFSNFENSIYQVAKFVEDRHRKKIGIKDIKAQGYLDKYREYLHLIGGIKSAQKNDSWNEIDIFKLVRNKLVHEGGYLLKNSKQKPEDKRKIEFLIENNVILAGSLCHIRVRQVYFLKKFCTLTNTIFDNLVREIELTHK